MAPYRLKQPGAGRPVMDMEVDGVRARHGGVRLAAVWGQGGRGTPATSRPVSTRPTQGPGHVVGRHVTRAGRDLSLYSTRTQNYWRWVLLRRLTQKNSTFALPNAKNTNMLVSLALGDANFLRRPCTFHFFV